MRFFVFMNFYVSEDMGWDMRINIGGLVIDADCFCNLHADIEYEFLEDPKKWKLIEMCGGGATCST